VKEGPLKNQDQVEIKRMSSKIKVEKVGVPRESTGRTEQLKKPNITPGHRPPVLIRYKAPLDLGLRAGGLSLFLRGINCLYQKKRSREIEFPTSAQAPTTRPCFDQGRRRFAEAHELGPALGHWGGGAGLAERKSKDAARPRTRRPTLSH